MIYYNFFFKSQNENYKVIFLFNYFFFDFVIFFLLKEKEVNEKI